MYMCCHISYFINTKCKHKNAFCFYLMLPRENSYPVAVYFLWCSNNIYKEIRGKGTFLPSNIFNWTSNRKASLWRAKTTLDRPHISFFLTNFKKKKVKKGKRKYTMSSVDHYTITKLYLSKNHDAPLPPLSICQ